MKIINPSIEFITPLNGPAVMKRLEQCGRVCYKSENRITEGSAETFLKSIIKRGHESVLEHCSFTIKITCDRGISHQFVRHRFTSFSQESTRYCNYSQDKFGNEITVIRPCYLDPDSRSYKRWYEACSDAEDAYFDLLELGCTPEEARAVLPTCLKTEIVMTANIREWRHLIKVRCSRAAHPSMREIATQLLKAFYREMPVLFEDIYSDVMGGD